MINKASPHIKTKNSIC